MQGWYSVHDVTGRTVATGRSVREAREAARDMGRGEVPGDRLTVKGPRFDDGEGDSWVPPMADLNRVRT